MVTKLVNRPLGIGNAYAPNKKEWIAAAIGAVGGLASALIGGAASSSAAEVAERRQKQQEAKENAWYTRRYNEDYIDTAAGQNLVIVIEDILRDRFVRADMNGVEIQFTETTQTISGKTYKVLTSENTYQAGTYNIDINS
jgi:predicted ATPase